MPNEVVFDQKLTLKKYIKPLIIVKNVIFSKKSTIPTVTFWFIERLQTSCANSNPKLKNKFTLNNLA